MLPFSILPTPPRLAVRALNTLLAREAWARERLARHAGKTVRFVAGGFTAGLAIDSEGYADLADAAVAPDVTLTVDLAKLNPLRLLPGQDKPDMAEATHIEGDAALARVVADLAADLRWDAEDDLARLVGDIPAARLVAGLRAAGEGARGAAGRLGRNLSEYLSEERPVLAGAPLLGQWRQDLAELSARTDGLARAAEALDARLARLAARRGA
ncbi:ubiquinone biosynthesis accessory factor UbiJ [Bordetella petrii]|uniref:ubiquinone biosynthesis accessory factor UbiJ n=1 Tax=Bordetella petrii TaxID=94624 RepID=UPI00048B41DD|nr:SCP2 sterol-binding domain-containing protein [Bordetella petrii]